MTGETLARCICVPAPAGRENLAMIAQPFFRFHRQRRMGAPIMLHCPSQARDYCELAGTSRRRVERKVKSVVQLAPSRPMRILFGNRHGMGNGREVIRRHRAGGASNEIAFEHDPQIIDLAKLIRIEPRHIGAAVRVDHDESFGLEAPQRLAHRNAAHPETLGKDFLPERASGRRLSPRDRFADRIGDEVGRRQQRFARFDFLSRRRAVFEEDLMSVQRRHISSGSTFERDIGYARAVIDGEWIFVSGTTGFDYRAGTIAESVTAQTAQCIKNIGEALEEAGSSFLDAVRVRYIFPDARDFEPCWPLLREAFGKARPAATMISAGLADPRMKIEIEVTAKRRQAAA